MKLSDLIKNYREENGISQREFARRCGLSNSLISILEMGVNPQTGKPTEPDARTYRRLANGMGMTASDLSKLLQTDSAVWSPLSAEGQYYELLKDNNLLPRTDEDNAILEALHKNPKLRALFSLQKGMSESSLDAITVVAHAIAKERGDDV